MSRAPLPCLVLALALAACATSPPTPNVELAPRPFTAGEIRDAMPVGTVLRLRMVNQGQATLEEWTVTRADADGCTIASKVFDDAGALLEDQGQGDSKWSELRDHASFPAATTLREDGHVEVPAGAFDTWHYVVTQPDEHGGKPLVTHYHFAKSLPGPPVSMVMTVDGEEIASLTLVSRR